MGHRPRIAQALNAASCNVSIWGRNADKNMRAAATMAKGPASRPANLRRQRPASVKAAMKATLDSFGRVDGCFANAGIGGGGRRAFIDRTEEEWRKMFATISTACSTCSGRRPHMTERAEAGVNVRARWSPTARPLRVGTSAAELAPARRVRHVRAAA